MSVKIPSLVPGKRAGEVTRRSFLQLSGLAAGLAVVSPAICLKEIVEPQVRFNNALYKGTGNGQILKSVDDGKSWQKVTNFGDHLAVVGLEVIDSQMRAILLIGANQFELISTDAVTWRSI